MGFSVTGLIIALAIFLPSILLGIVAPKGMPAGGVKDAGGMIVLLERLGQIGCLALTVMAGSHFARSALSIWLVLMVLCIAGYYALWGRYLAKGRLLVWLYRPWGILPVPMAVLPVLAFSLAALWGRFLLLGIAAMVLAAGHIANSLHIYKELKR